MPASMERARISAEAASSIHLPNAIVPRLKFETRNPDFPRFEYFIEVFPPLFAFRKHLSFLFAAWHMNPFNTAYFQAFIIITISLRIRYTVINRIFFKGGCPP